MKVVITVGCTAFNTTFDGISFNSIPVEEQGKIIDHLLVKVKENFLKNQIGINDIVELFQYDSYGSEKDSCEQCGDTVSWTIYEI